MNHAGCLGDRLLIGKGGRVRRSFLRASDLLKVVAVVLLFRIGLYAQCDGLARVDLCEFCPSTAAVVVQPILVPVDCSLPLMGCQPGGESFTLQVSFEGQLFAPQSAQLIFASFSAQQFAQLKFTGDGVIEADAVARSVRFDTKGINVSNIPNPPIPIPPIVQFVPPFGVNDLQVQPPGSQIFFRVNFTTLLGLGPEIVNEYTMMYQFNPCPAPVKGADEVVLHGNRDFDLSAILLDYQPAGAGASATNDLLVRARDKVGVPELLDEPSPSNRKPQIAVLSEENAFHFKNDVDTSGSTHPQELTSLVRVPINIWVAPNDSTKLQDWLVTAAKLVLYANYVYNNQRAGVWFDASGRITSIHSMSSPAPGGMPHACVAGEFKECGRTSPCNFKKGELNVYLISTSNFDGKYCDSVQPNAILIRGGTSMPDTLAHEIGHAFLRDANHLSSGNCKNLMFHAGDVRKYITIGQAYRMNIHDQSMLNLNRHREAHFQDISPPSVPAVRACPPSVSADRDCPDIMTDVPGTLVTP